VNHRIARLGLLVAVLAVSACGTISTSPAVTPADFQGVAGAMRTQGIALDHLVSGDAGCPDPTLTKTAIGFDASGLDQSTVIRVRIYIFGNADSYQRLRSTIDACAAAFVTDPATFQSIDDSPYVLAGQGPWAPKFEAALRQALKATVGTDN